MTPGRSRTALLLLLAASAGAAQAPAPPPAWEVATVTPDAIELAASTYVVKPGDTLTRVIEKTGASADAIARANDLSPPFRLRLGRRLKIPAGRYHRVGKGQSGIAIARAYGVDWSRIATLNHLEEPFVLRAGDRLLLPSRTEVAHMTLEQRAAAFRIDIDDLVTGGEPALAATARPAPPTRSAARTVSPTVPVATPDVAFTGRFAWPAFGRVARGFGVNAYGGRNDGIDIDAERGTPIVAAADGVVAWAAEYPAFGRLILLRHGSGWVTIYGRVEGLAVARGQAVTRGQTIARAGASELHFEIRDGRRPVSPLGLLPARG